MPISFFYLFVLLIGFVGLVPTSQALSFREDKKKTYTRLVLESEFGGDFVSQPVLRSPILTMLVKGGVCSDLGATPVIKSKIIKAFSFEALENKRCRIIMKLRHSFTLKRVFTLKGKKPPSIRFVVDLVPHKKQSSMSPMIRHVYLKRWQEEPPQKPSHRVGISLKGGGVFYPHLFLKPFRPTIILDPGHGGYDPGSISCSGYFEKRVTLRASKIIAEILKKQGRYHVLLTRQRDTFVSKRSRFAIARDAKADFLISIHADNHPSKKMRGLTIYTLSTQASDKEAARLAKRENKTEFLGDFHLTDHTSPYISTILIDIAQRGSKNTALVLAKKLHSCLCEGKVGKVMTLRSADLAVLKAPDTPSLLIELGYLSNKKDEKLVRSMAYQKKLAQALVRALDDYFGNL